MCWGQSADSCRVLRGALWWVCVLLNTNQLPRYVPQPPLPLSHQPCFPNLSSASVCCRLLCPVGCLARGSGRFRLVAWVSEGDGEVEPADGPGGVHLAADGAAGDEAPKRVPPLHVSRRLDGSVPHKEQAFPAEPVAGQVQGLGGSGDGSSSEGPPSAVDPEATGGVCGARGAPMEDDDGLNFEVPVEALGRVGGLVERLAGSTTITWDLGAMPESDPLHAYLHDEDAAAVANHLRMPTSAPSALAGFDLLNTQECSMLFEGARVAEAGSAERFWLRCVVST